MTDKNLSKALLQGETPIDAQALTARILKRDRRRIWFLGIACIIAWMLVVMLPWATILPMLAKVVEHQADLARTADPANAPQQQRSLEVLQIVKTGTIATFVGSLSTMFIAALCTVCLIIFSRRSTLRQLNSRLVEISAQLKSRPPQ